MENYINGFEEKNRLRNQFASMAFALSDQYKRVSSEEITRRILSCKEYIEANSLFVYLSTDVEVSTTRLIEEAWADGKQVLVPKIVGRGLMEALPYNENTELELYQGIRQPISGTAVKFAEIQLAIVPSVSCTLDGRRLGHGGGFYDRFLSDFKGYSIAPVFSDLVSKHLPMDRWDKKVDMVVTESSKGE